jgi:maleylacetate reductase
VQPFVFDQPAQRVIFGAGRLASLRDEVARLGLRRVVVISTPQESRFAEDAARRLADLSAGIYPEVAAQHVPVELLARARERVEALRVDGYVAVGGGSTIGVAKAMALDTGLPVVAVPTTYAGSEMTPIYGITEAGVKKTGRDRRVLPKTVIYDAHLTVSLPPHISGPSGINAMAHCVEALYAQDGNPITSLVAEEGIRALARSLPRVVAEPGNIDARSDAQYGAWLGGSALGAVGMSIHHKLCHTLGGTFNLPHAETHAVILPHAAAYNREAAPEAMRRIAAALGGSADAAGGLFEVVQRVGAPTALKDIGMPADGLDRAATLATENPYFSPRPIEYRAVRDLLQQAFEGRRPTRAGL